jgi:acetyl-CoA acetyltransferase
VLSRHRWRRRVDLGRRRARPRLPAKACPWLEQGPVYLLGTGESVETPMVSQMEDFTSSRAFRVAGPKAFAEAGITHNDVDHLMIYDAFAHLPIYGLEDLGLCRAAKT